ncbi:unnamed protein product [Rangifer tarandus platyrhynchus]|uniref:Uncharacterized protein n=1 Tax=Rangifer tarandus platyrhynchus TaxID=3082113 RepID=A0ABN8Y326_RANTA|nr:unnamed protein product [Rangifer tarandus platyrhynchus]
MSRYSWNLLIVTQNASPNLLSRHDAVLTKAAHEFWSLLGGSRRKGRARSSGPRRLRAGWAEHASAAFGIFFVCLFVFFGQCILFNQHSTKINKNKEKGIKLQPN